jgi:hypothetical protein
MIDVRLPELRVHAFEGNFGLEREALRVTDEGRMAHTPHPFSADHPRVVRDFCENQTEINTRVWPSAEEAVAELESLNADILREIAAKNGELLWPFSNPPPLEGEDDVIPAKFTGHRAGKIPRQRHFRGRAVLHGVQLLRRQRRKVNRDLPNPAGVDPVMMKRFRTLCDIAGRNNIKLMPYYLVFREAALFEVLH